MSLPLSPSGGNWPSPFQDLAHSSRIIFPGWPISHRRELPVHAENARANPPDPEEVKQARICCAFCATFLHAAPRHNSNRGGVASSSGGRERERESKALAGINADSRQRGCGNNGSTDRLLLIFKTRVKDRVDLALELSINNPYLSFQEIYLLFSSSSFLFFSSTANGIIFEIIIETVLLYFLSYLD